MTISKNIILLVLACVSLSVIAQDADTGSFNDIDIKRAGKVQGNFKSENFIERMYDGVSLTFIGETPEDNLDVDATAIDFDYSGSTDGSPSKLTLTGNVEIKNAEMRIKAPKAVINTATNTAEFIGVSEIYLEGRAPMKSENIQVDLESGDITLTEVTGIKND